MDLDIKPIIPHLIEDLCNFKAFIFKGCYCLVGHSKAQQFCFYMCDDKILVMKFNVLWTSLIWSFEDGIFVYAKTNMANVCYHMENQSLVHLIL